MGRVIPSYPTLPSDPADQSQVETAITTSQAVPTADVTTNTKVRDVVGNKTDAAVTAVAATKSLMAYIKGIVNWLTVAVADAVTNASAKDVIGNKEDAAVIAVGTTKSIVAYAKGVLEMVQKCTTAKEKHVAGDIFTIAGGPIRVDAIIGRVTTAIDAAATPKLQFTATGGAAIDLCGASGSLDTKAAETLLGVDGVKATGMVICTDNGIGLKTLSANMPIYLGTGVISLVNAGAAINTGRISWQMFYTPLDPAVTVT